MVNLDTIARTARKKWLYNALYIDQIRGHHSTGLFIQPKQVFSTKQFPLSQLYKRALPASDFLQLDAVRSMFINADDCAVAIGHNRWATQGATGADSNAHPFSYGDIVMVHNGTLDNRNGLETPHTVDSAAIAIQLSKTDPSKYTEVLSKLEGAYTLVWNNKALRKVFFTRNPERPLFIASGHDGKTMYFSSEGWMITELLDRGNTLSPLDKDKDGEWNISEIPAGKLFSIDYTKDKIDIEEEEYIQVPKKVKNYSGYGGSSMYDAYDTAYGDKYAKYTHTKTDDKTTTTIPYKVRNKVYATDFKYVRESTKNRGKVVCTSPDFDNLQMIIPNVSTSKYAKLVDDWNESKLLCKDNTGYFPVVEGIITGVTKVKGVDKYIVSLKPKSINVELYTYATDDDDDFEEEDDKDTGKELAIVGGTDTEDMYPIAGKYVKLRTWLEKTSVGCSWCGETLMAAAAVETTWESSIVNGKEVLDPVCPACSALSPGNIHLN